MKKKEVINYLETNKVEHNNEDNYQDLLKLYYGHVKSIESTEEVISGTTTTEEFKTVEETVEVIQETVSNVEVKSSGETIGYVDETTEVIGIVEEDEVEEINNTIEDTIHPELLKLGTIRAKLIVEIIEFMNNIKGKTRASQEEIKLMFHLYNNFYKRAESPKCQVCIGNVHSKLKMIHKKYSKLIK